MTLDDKSLSRLREVHPDLRKVIERAAAASPVPFLVTEGRRSVKRQRELLAAGKSKTMRSRHLTGHAVDIAPLVNGKPSWDWAHYHPLAKLIKQAAQELNIPIEWGGDWKTFKDGPHWQLPHARYPDA